MNNPFYNASSQGGMNNMLQQLKANPAMFLAQKGIAIPQGMTDPNAILNHLLSSGKISQAQINNAFQMGKRMGM